jgi:hypothetical protein
LSEDKDCDRSPADQSISDSSCHFKASACNFLGNGFFEYTPDGHKLRFPPLIKAQFVSRDMRAGLSLREGWRRQGYNILAVKL